MNNKYQAIKLALSIFFTLFIVSGTYSADLSQLDCDQIKQTLERSGWRVELSDHGDVLLVPPQSGKIQQNTQTVDTMIKSEYFTHSLDYQRLKQKLEPNGWRVEKGNDGSVYLYPRQVKEAPENEEKNTPDFYSPLHQLRSKLEKLGWKVERDDKGGLLLFPQRVLYPVVPVREGIKIKRPIIEVAASNTDSQTLADSDKDGIPDNADLCNNTITGTDVNSTGCNKTNSIILEGVNFNSGSATLTTQAIDVLEDVAAKLKHFSGQSLQVIGHTDSAGSEQMNLGLSRRRAETVHNFLLQRNIGTNDISFEGQGEYNPIANNSTAAGRRKNRRVELKVQ